MPTFSARLSPKSHFPGPNTGIVFGLFLSISFYGLFSRITRDASKTCRNVHILSKPYHILYLESPGIFAVLLKLCVQIIAVHLHLIGLFPLER